MRIAKSIDEVGTFAKEMLGHTLVTVQTGPAGKPVNRLYIEDGSDILREFYLSVLVDRVTSRVSFVVSTEGGMFFRSGRLPQLTQMTGTPAVRNAGSNCCNGPIAARSGV